MSNMHGRISDFYAGKSILLTGATGFVGTVLLETLLRTCPGIMAIYIPLRDKRGLSPELRKGKIFQQEIFDKLRKENPEVFRKVHAVSGDASLPNLGLTEEDVLNVEKQVTIVFHCAASVNFKDTPSELILHNVAATQNVITLCRKLKKLEVLVHTSTAYANCNRGPEIKEEVYSLPFPAQTMLDTLKEKDERKLLQLASQCKPKWPNWYAFSKCVTENLLQETASDLPIAIIRPSAIIQTWKGPSPGYIDNHVAIVFFQMSAVAAGFIKVMRGKPHLRPHFIPADIVSNTHVVAAWSVATKLSESPLVVSCAPDDRPTTRHFVNAAVASARQNPLPNSFQRPPHTIRLEGNDLSYWYHSILEHYIPALVSDMFFRLKGIKLRLLPVYTMWEKSCSLSAHFAYNHWDFEQKNKKKLANQLPQEEKEVLYIDMEPYPETECATLPKLSVHIANWMKEPYTISEIQEMLKGTEKYISLAQHIVIVCSLFLLYIFFINIWRIIM